MGRAWALSVGGIVAVAFMVARAVPIPAPGDPVPPLRGETLDGKSYQADWSRNRLTLVNFWATWCAPCQQEMPRLQQLYAKHRHEGFLVLGVHVGRRDEPVAEFVENLGVEYPILKVRWRDLGLWAAGGVVPTTCLVDREGRLVRRYVGAHPQIVQDVEAYLEGKPLPALAQPEAAPTATPPERR